MWADALDFRQFIRNTYITALQSAGACVITLPICTYQQDFDQILNLVDGLVFSGGADIDASLYGEELSTDFCPVPLVIERDLFEIELMNRAVEEDLPILAICRGMQLMNVKHGGTLYQHIPDAFKTEVDHAREGDVAPGTVLVHEVSVCKGSKLHCIVGKDQLAVNSFHHQAVKKLGDNLAICAVSEDGVVEAIENPHVSFALGVQWHPEIIVAQGDKPSAHIFDAFTEAARSYRHRKMAGMHEVVRGVSAL